MTHKTAIESLNHYQHKLLYNFFDVVEDKASDVIDHLTMIKEVEGILSDDPERSEQELGRLFQENLEMFNRFERFCEARQRHLLVQGVPEVLIAPVIGHAVLRIQRKAGQILKTS